MKLVSLLVDSVGLNRFLGTRVGLDVVVFCPNRDEALCLRVNICSLLLLREEEELLVDVAATADDDDDDDGKTVGAELSIDRLFDDALLE